MVLKSGIQCDLRSGNMFLASKPSDLAWMAEEIACFEREMNYAKAKLLDRNAIKSEIASDLYFGGIKDSGNGYKEGVIEAMKSYTNVKTFSLPWG